MIFFAARAMLHGQFTLYDRGAEGDGRFIPPFVLIGAFFLSIALRKKSLTEGRRESSEVEGGDKSEDERESQPPKN